MALCGGMPPLETNYAFISVRGFTATTTTASTTTTAASATTTAAAPTTIIVNVCWHASVRTHIQSPNIARTLYDDTTLVALYALLARRRHPRGVVRSPPTLTLCAVCGITLASSLSLTVAVRIAITRLEAKRKNKKPCTLHIHTHTHTYTHNI
ncbi:unnamed protein product [Aphis gossypii]|uniref:Uncharacterized protein n=1 Tax=Aphis gossypii TaxID=80765 RepID=A0A9P0J6K9_APHGO|nr:unnamed protein product [Aphis gossypii]